MQSAVRKQETFSTDFVRAPGGLDRAERVAFAFFVWLAILSIFRPLALFARLVVFAIPLTIHAFSRWSDRPARTRTKIIREWASLGLILTGYWTVGLFASKTLNVWQNIWLGWDRFLLNTLGLRHAIEAFGALIPFFLESAYLLLYTVPVVSLGALYLCGARANADRFRVVLFLGTFTAYGMLPIFPVISPRVAFPGADLPAMLTAPRIVNGWVLDHLDITTSVFPSGHVAVAFATAFGLFTAVRHRPAIWIAAFINAVVVYIATVYGRYHFAVDGFMSLVITYLAWRVATRWTLRDE